MGLDAVGALLCAAVLATSVVVAVVADAPQEQGETHVEDLSGLKEPGDPADPGVRALPLLDPEGPVAATFPGGVGLDDPAKVDATMAGLAGRLGLGPVIDILRATSVVNPDSEVMQDLDAYEGYPYRYVLIDPLVDEWLTAEAVQTDPAALLDLAGMMLLDAVRSQRAHENPVSSEAGVAYSLLRRARELAPSCDIQLDLTFVLAMGFAPHIQDVETEAAHAMADCPDDPTPLWLLGQVQAGQASLIESFFTYERGPRAMARAAEASFAQLRRDHPDSPLGWAGTADLYLQLADEAEQLGTQQFQVRAWRSEALSLYAEARRLSDDPALLAGWGRALSVNGRDDEAVEVLTDLQERLPWDPARQMLLLDALTRADRPTELVEVVEASPAADQPLAASLSLSPRRVGVREPESYVYGFGGSRAGSVLDMSFTSDAGSSVRDLGFIPVSNGAWSEPWCRAGMFVSALIQDGRTDPAWTLMSDGVDPESWDGNSVDCHGSPLPEETYLQPGFSDSLTALGRLGLVAALETGHPDIRADALARSDDGYTSQDALLSQALDAQADFWRAAGDPDRARGVVDGWREELPEDPWARHRAGELAFLAGGYEEAAADYERALELFAEARGDDVVWGDHGLGPQAPYDVEGRAATRLELGAALELGGHTDEARTAYEAAVDDLAGLEESDYVDELSFYASSQLGSLELAEGDLEDAAAHLEASLERDYEKDGPPGPGDEIGWGRQVPDLSRGAQDNNLALALAKLGRHDESVVYAGAALAHDPANPIYVDTVAFAQHQAGHEHEAAEAYRAAMEADPTSYVSANNLAVLLAQDGHRADAAAVLEDVVRVAPDYAIGWHNLGVVLSAVSRELLRSQGALTAAGRLDRELRDRVDLIVDTEIYESGLDVSKPLPPDWTYAASATSAADRFTLTILVLLALRVLWTLGLDKIVGVLNERIMTRGRGRRGFWRHLPPVLALAAAAVVLGLPLARSDVSVLQRLLLVGAVSAMVLLPFLLRRLVAHRAHSDIRHEAWAPAIAVGLAGVPFGLAFAPYPSISPSIRAEQVGQWVRWVVPAAIAPAAATFLVIAALDPVPLARTLAVVGTALFGSVLTPVPPLDGAHLTNRLVNLLATLALTAATVAFTLKWV